MSHNNYVPPRYKAIEQAVFEEVKHVWPEACVRATADMTKPGWPESGMKVRVSIFRHNQEVFTESTFPEEQFSPPVHVIASTMRRQFTEGVHKALRGYENDLRNL